MPTRILDVYIQRGGLTPKQLNPNKRNLIGLRSESAPKWYTGLNGPLAINLGYDICSSLENQLILQLGCQKLLPAIIQGYLNDYCNCCGAGV
jgi:hypothetical protein